MTFELQKSFHSLLFYIHHIVAPDGTECKYAHSDENDTAIAWSTAFRFI
jgi:hypothetical protein